jgi:protein-tyrosine phosphatase
MSLTASRGLADIHCHLMPYVDDGAYDRDECLELLKMEAAQGVRTICLTPHLRADMFESTDEMILEHFAMVRELVQEAELPLKLYHSREYHFDRVFRKRLASGQLRPLGEGNYLLVEFNGRHSAEEMLEAVAMVRSAGWQPLIAHVERYTPVHQDWTFADALMRSGACLQINAGSVLGREGLRQRLLCKKLLQKGLVHVIGSDAHDASVRKPELDACAQVLEKKYGRSLARELLCTNPLAILQGSKEITPCSK